MRNLVLEGLRVRKLGDIGYVSYSISKVSDVERNPELRMIREVEYHEHRVGGLQKS